MNTKYLSIEQKEMLNAFVQDQLLPTLNESILDEFLELNSIDYQECFDECIDFIAFVAKQ